MGRRRRSTTPMPELKSGMLFKTVNGRWFIVLDPTAKTALRVKYNRHSGEVALLGGTKTLGSGVTAPENISRLWYHVGVDSSLSACQIRNIVSDTADSHAGVRCWNKPRKRTLSKEALEQILGCELEIV